MTMIAALSRQLQCDQEKIRSAYSLMPDLGSIAAMASSRELDAIVIQPKIPIRFMVIRSGKPVIPGVFLPKYPGLRVQVHKTKGEVLFFTSRLRSITSALNGLSQHVGEIDADFIADADLIGFQDGNICSHLEMVRYINRRRLSRKSSIHPALLAYDLIALQGEDICSMPYQDRRKKLLSILGKPKDMPFSGISSADEKVLLESSAVDDYLGQAGKAGARGLLERNIQAAYRPGIVAERDFIIRAADIISPH